MAQFKKEKKEMYLNAMVSCCVGVIPDKWANYKVPIDRRLTTNWHCYISLCLGRLNSWVVSHSALIIGKLCHALGCEFKPWWWQTLFRTQAQHLCFIHDSIWFIWFDTIICLSNLSCELWNRKLKIKEIYLKKYHLKHKWQLKLRSWGRSPGVVVMGGDSYFKGSEVESLHIFQIICC